MKVCSICHRCYEDSVVSCAESEHPELSEAREGGTQAIAGYHLDTMVESGIKGETYRARRTDSDQPCLIKLISPNEEYKQRFLLDAKTATTIFNESIVDVYEADSLESGEVFVVAEDPAGQTARELLNNVGVPQLLTTVQVVRQAAEAVHALHLTGLIHRAIRPENIVLTTDAEHRLLVRIQNIDLGGVSEHAIVSNKFLIDSALDSLRYFAPDLFSGEGSGVRSDIYSLGIVLYEMLAGIPPFDSDKASGLIDMHRNQRPPDVTIDNFDLRMLLTHTLMESLQKQPGKRQSSANAFARQLRHIEQLATHCPTPPAAGVAPPVPPRTSVATGTGTPAKLAPVIEPPRVVNIQGTQPVVVKVDAELLAIPKPAAALEVVQVPSSLVSDEIEAAPSLDLDAAAEQSDEQAYVERELPILVIDKADSVPPKSRLKRMKKQLRTFTTPNGAAASAEPSTPPIVEADQEGSSIASASATPRTIGLEQPVEEIYSSDVITSSEERLEAPSAERREQEVPIVAAATAAVAAVAAPRRIEREQLEDDLPSLDDIPEALFSEPMPVAHVVLQPRVAALPPPVSSIPRKIEWEQPEEDIPSMDDVSGALVSEPVAAVSTIAEPQVLAPLPPVSSVPRKIEWELSDDDIPSMDDVLQVLSEEPIIEAAFVDQIMEEAAPVQLGSGPKRIEWEQPDDIPSMEDVMDVPATEQIAEIAFVPPVYDDVAAATRPTVAKKIEWEQPEDDIPSMEDVMEVLATESIVETAFVPPVSEDVGAATPPSIATNFKWEPPEADVPSMEDVMDVLATEQIAEVVSVPSMSEDVTAATPLRVAKKIEWEQPEDDIPSLEEAVEVLAMEGSVKEVPIIEPQPAERDSAAASHSELAANANVSSVVVPASVGVQIAEEIANIEPGSPVQDLNVISVVDPEPEEITLVSPPRRLTIDWEQPKPWEALSKEIEFFPTLLGDVDTKRKADPHSETFFSNYDDEAESGSSDHYRSLMIGSGFIVLIVLFLFGNDSVWTYLQNGSATGSVAVQTSPAKQTFPQSGQTSAPSDQRLLKSVEKAKSSDDVETGESKASPIRVSASSSEGTVTSPSDKSPEQKKGPQTKAPEKSAGKTTVVPSTLVISSDNGKISSKVEPQKRKSPEPTRPRIVENPNP